MEICYLEQSALDSNLSLCASMLRYGGFSSEWHKGDGMNQESSIEGRYASNKQHLCPEHDLKLCPCGCGRVVEGRKDKKYYSRICKDRARNRRSRNAQNNIKTMAIALRTTLKAAQELLDSVDPQ